MPTTTSVTFLRAADTPRRPLAQYQKALQIDPDDADAHYNCGVALNDLRATRRGHGRVSKGPENRTQTTPSLTSISETSSLAADSPDEAIAQYRKALEIDPHHVAAHCDIANVLTGLGRLDEAIIHYQEALKVNPDEAVALRNLAVTQAQRKALLDALARRRELLRQKPNDIALLNDTAWLLATNPNESVRNGAEALELALRAAKLSDSREPAILGTLAAAYAETGRFAEAVKTAREALQLATEQNKEALAKINPSQDSTLPSPNSLSGDAKLTELIKNGVMR